MTGVSSMSMLTTVPLLAASLASDLSSLARLIFRVYDHTSEPKMVQRVTFRVAFADIWLHLVTFGTSLGVGGPMGGVRCRRCLNCDNSWFLLEFKILFTTKMPPSNLGFSFYNCLLLRE